MSLWESIKKLFVVNDTIMDEIFSLGERYGDQKESEEQDEKDTQDNGRQENPPETEHGFKKPLKPEDIQKKQRREKEEGGDHEGPLSKKIDLTKLVLSSDLDENRALIKKVFRMPLNKDFVIRDFTLSLEPEVKGFLIYTEGMASRDTINLAILEPFMHLSKIECGQDKKPVDLVYEELLPSNQVEKKHKVKDLVEGILGGLTAVFINGFEGGLIVETRGMPSRGVGTPLSEQTVRGPQEAFNEHFRTNTALVRKHLKSEKLITEMTKVGDLNKADVAIMYIDGIVNPKLVKEVKRRLKAIKVDNVIDSGIVEELISDNNSSMVPGTLATERPDRVCSYLMEGHVALIMDGSPQAVILPVTFWSLMQTPEDYYISYPFGIFFRIVRVISFFVALLTPALYIAISNYHQEMLPTQLILAAAAARERVPFPAIVEVLLMEVAFELIREAGARTPSLLGSTIGIVGALILGQAAVEANIVSPLLVIVVAITALGAYAIPNYSLSFGIRIVRFIFVLAASILGLYGIAIGMFMFTIHLCGLKAFGVPVMSPVAPFRPPSRDIIIRYPYWFQNKRPEFLRTKNEVRQKPITMTWDPANERLKPEDIPGFEKKGPEEKGKGPGKGGGQA